VSASPQMTDPQGDTPREFNPRHRIMGAVVLVSLAVIFVPMILEDRPSHEPVPEQAVSIPGKDSRLFVSKITPIETTTSTDPAPVKESPAGPAPEAAAAPGPKAAAAPAPAPAKSETSPAPEPAASKPAPAPPANAVAPAESWAVRVGTFSQRARSPACGWVRSPRARRRSSSRRAS